MSDAIWMPSPGAMLPSWWWKFERQPNGCKLWTGTVNDAGYGRSEGQGPAAGEVYVHRIIYVLLVGPLPKRDAEGRRLDVDHTCHNEDPTCRGLGNLCLHRRCGEKTHLALKTHTQHLADTVATRGPKTECKYGHPLSGDNLRIDPRTGDLICKACNREKQAEFRKRVVQGEKAPPPSWIAEGYRDKTKSPTDNNPTM